MVAAYVLLAVIIVGFFAGSASFVVWEIENELIDKRLSHAAEHWAADSYNPVLMQTIDLSFLRGTQIPQPLQHLAPGTHELRLNGRGLHVLIGEVKGERYAVVDDQSDFESIESSSYIALGIAFLGGIALAILIGRASANRVILPLTKLASAVQDGQQAGDLPGLDATDEIGVLARAIEDRTNQLSLALQRERWFTADVSHELRTPLTIMLGAAEVLTSRLRDRPDLLVMTERIRRNASDTAQQVGALLQLARAPESTDLCLVALRPLVERELERCQPLLRGKPLTLQFEAPDEVLVQAIPELVTIMVSNLIRNACQHTEQGTIRVRLTACQIVVEDSGTGLPEAVRARLFDRFVRGSENFTDGSGLGLSIVKRVAEHLGWTVRHDPAATGGSRFTLKFAAT
ncbi:two-component sensor histidine kinase [Metapseudomonas resinovorans]|uniref:sensor histidine kinase n=1 Tax=Metapseudomonas resinovorans TaxID=53412 RepID=UPI00131C7339|nr:HAMP domain-containing sensor histidine kinase [Pseudomonas resinovorans]GLZ87997.1 two-component sensor histidine kinase [Pseudomonas resinovorans]